jgi:hypothetical protein
MHALRLTRARCPPLFSGGVTLGQVSGGQFRSVAAEINVASGTDIGSPRSVSPKTGAAHFEHSSRALEHVSAVIELRGSLGCLDDRV